MRKIFLASLLISFSSLGFANPSCLEKIQQLVQKSWVDEKDTRSYLKALQPSNEKSFLEFAGINPHLLPKLTSFREEYTFFKSPDGERPVLITSIYNEDALESFVVFSFVKDDNGVLHVTGEYLKHSTNVPSQLGTQVLQQLDNFYRALSVKSTQLRAAWEGRVHWAQSGYDLDATGYFVENGKITQQIDQMRQNFLRFLNFHQIKLEDLYVYQNGERKELSEDLSELRTPRDFLHIQHKEKLKIETAAYVDEGTLSEVRALPVGLAFTLWDYRPRPGQEITIDRNDGMPLSDIAMPPWLGIKQF
jgi:hypothetical protein